MNYDKQYQTIDSRSYDVDAYINRFMKVMSAITTVMDKYRSDKLFGEWIVLEDDYIDYKVHKVLIRASHKEMEARISLEIEPVFIWFLNDELFSEEIVKILQAVASKVKAAFDPSFKAQINPDDPIAVGRYGKEQGNPSDKRIITPARMKPAKKKNFFN